MMKFSQDKFKAQSVGARRHQAEQNAGGLCQILFLSVLLILIVKPELFGMWWEYGPVRKTASAVVGICSSLLGFKEEL